MNDDYIDRDEFLKKIAEKIPAMTICDKMKKDTLPLIIWGGGSLSYSVRKILKKEGISITAFWIDECTLGSKIDGIPVMDIENIYKQFGEVNVVLGHSKYEMADSIMRRYSFIRNCFCLVNICYGLNERIEYSFIKNHAEEYVLSYNLLQDELSRNCLLAYLNCKVTENFRYLLPCCVETAAFFENSIFTLSNAETYVDIGAYTGDTIREFLNVTGGQYKEVVAIEPECASFSLLQSYVEQENLQNICLFQTGTWNSNTTLWFENDEESSGIGEKGEKIQVNKIDTLLQGVDVTLMKINFLYGVVETLEGAADILKTCKPKLAITVGFDQYGIISVPQKIKEINPEYKIYLRYAAAMPARLILFAC